jgi:hypothetical protein
MFKVALSSQVIHTASISATTERPFQGTPARLLCQDLGKDFSPHLALKSLAVLPSLGPLALITIAWPPLMVTRQWFYWFSKNHQ